jgi:hypothetical protein
MMVQLSPEASAFMEKIVDGRGASILAFAQVEWFLAKIILEAKDRTEYKHLDLSFSQDAEKRAERVKAILGVQGAFTPYSDELRRTIDAILQYVDLRNYAAHGLLVRVDPNDFSLSSKLLFRMFRMYKDNKLVDGSRLLTLKDYTDEQAALTKAAREFVAVVRKIWVELGLKELEAK